MSQHLERYIEPQELDVRVLGKLRRFGILYLLARQYEDPKPAQQALRQPQAPHHAGLFALGS